MSVSESHPDSSAIGATNPRDELGGIQANAGAVLARHHDRAVALSYGSAAGELAACMNAVGVASRAELTKLELTAPEPSIERMIAGLLGVPLLAGGIYKTRAVGWYRPDGGRLIVLCGAEDGERLRARLKLWTLRDAAIKVLDRTDEWTAIAVIGRRAPLLLCELGVYGQARDPRAVPPATRTSDDPRTSWLLHADDDALAITPRGSGPGLWRRITRAGRPLQICAVGYEALTRYRMLTERESGR
jgi:glycine cleavage system aminomethyltransferase T